ncbi:MAG TPA: hypothetical protein VGJ71_14455 [Candidatus Limnocylindrales bacterium]|jgi:spore coat polysaccharide biosynthesis predicted glycosyltransferase SpsG
MAARPAIRLVVTAAPDEGRGHLARAIGLAGAIRRRDTTVPLELEILRGATSERERHLLAERGIILASGMENGRDVTIVDLPDPNEVAGLVGPLFVFDDRELFAGQAAVVVQPSMPSWSGRAAADRVLVGYEYAPLDERYLALGEAAVGAEDRVLTLLVCFGGSDPDDVTGRVGPALVGDDRWRTTIVVGAGYRGSVEHGPAAATVVRDPEDLPGRLASCDLAVLGAGTMKFEAAFLGRPAILLAAADDQLPVGPAFAATGAAIYLGDGRTIAPKLVTEVVEGLAGDDPARRAMGRRAREVVDGRGGERLAAAILDLAGSR